MTHVTDEAVVEFPLVGVFSTFRSVFGFHVGQEIGWGGEGQRAADKAADEDFWSAAAGWFGEFWGVGWGDFLVDAAGEVGQDSRFDFGLEVALGALEEGALEGGIFVELQELCAGEALEADVALVEV